MEKNGPKNAGLIQFRAEARTLLRLKDEPVPKENEQPPPKDGCGSAPTSRTGLSRHNLAR
jgi:hypothetical protein